MRRRRWGSAAPGACVDLRSAACCAWRCCNVQMQAPCASARACVRACADLRGAAASRRCCVLRLTSLQRADASSVRNAALPWIHYSSAAACAASRLQRLPWLRRAPVSRTAWFPSTALRRRPSNQPSAKLLGSDVNHETSCTLFAGSGCRRRWAPWARACCRASCCRWARWQWPQRQWRRRCTWARPPTCPSKAASRERRLNQSEASERCE